TVRVPRCPRAGRKVHHELYHLGLQGSIRDAEPRLGDNPASPWIAGIETVWPSTAIAGVAAIRVAMVRTRRLAELRLFGMKHPLFVTGPTAIVGQALSSWGGPRRVAICPRGLRPPPRTTGQYGSGSSSARRSPRRPEPPPPQVSTWRQVLHNGGTLRACAKGSVLMISAPRSSKRSSGAPAPGQ